MHTNRADVNDQVDPDTPNEQGLQNLVVNSEVGSNNHEWDDFVSEDNNVEIAKVCADKGIVHEVQGQRATLESGDDTRRCPRLR